jgi:alpha-aminoadipic semialdehyde synthase
VYLEDVNFVLNNIYWTERFPRLITSEGLAKSVASGNCRLMGVTDISADFAGSIEFTKRFTSIDEPFLAYNP